MVGAVVVFTSRRRDVQAAAFFCEAAAAGNGMIVWVGGCGCQLGMLGATVLVSTSLGWLKSGLFRILT